MMDRATMYRPLASATSIRLKYAFLVIDIPNRVCGPIFQRNDYGTLDVCQIDVQIDAGDCIMYAWNRCMRPYMDPQYRDLIFEFHCKIDDVFVCLVSHSPLSSIAPDIVYLTHHFYNGAIMNTSMVSRRYSDQAARLWRVMLTMVPKYFLQQPFYGVLRV